MAELAFTGAFARAAHYAYRPPVPGVSPEHEHPDPEPDPFQPMPAPVQGQSGEIYLEEEVSAQSEMLQRPIDHWAHLQPPVPTSVPSEVAGIAATARMIANHAQVDYRPEQYPAYKHGDQGRSIEYVRGREPWQAGEDVPDGSAYLMMGKNAYDRTNQPNEVYAGDATNVGRYRLGAAIADFGQYTPFQKVGQDAELRAYTGLTPDLSPLDKPVVQDAAPYTGAVSNASYVTPAFQIPSMFALPGESALTDYEAASTEGYWDGGGAFLETEGY